MAAYGDGVYSNYGFFTTQYTSVCMCFVAYLL